MPKRGPSPIARGAALLALSLAFVLVVYTVATIGDGNGDGNGSQATATERPQNIPPRFRKALRKGVYVVRPGDTLTGIAQGTGMDVDDLIDLNPKVDPQALIAGERIRLR